MVEEKPVFNFNTVEQMGKMNEEIDKENKKEEEENLKVIKDRNTKARQLLQRFSEPVEYDIDGIIFTMRSISVKSWDTAEGDKDDPVFQSHIVRDSLLSPELSDEEFSLLPAGLKYKLFMFLLQDFFLIAEKVKRKK